MVVRRDRIGGGIAALLVQAGLFLGLYLGLIVVPGQRAGERALIYVEPVVAPEVVPEPPRARAVRPKGKAAPAAVTAIATPIVVPPPVVETIVIPPIVAAEIASVGSAATSGAAAAGTGTGSGGIGTGSGSGDAGGGGGGGGVPAEWLKGRIRDRDYPYEAMIGGIEGRLVARYVIGTDGRVGVCTVVQSSGNAILDGVTCRLVKQRFRYRPARDAAGRRVIDVIEEEHAWVIERPDPRLETVRE